MVQETSISMTIVLVTLGKMISILLFEIGFNIFLLIAGVDWTIATCSDPGLTQKLTAVLRIGS